MYKVFSERTNTSKPTPKLEEVYNNLLVNKTAGFTQIPSRPELFEQSESWVKELKSKFEHFVIVGIGGSSMGSRALVDLSGNDNIYFLENVDSSEFRYVWKLLNKSED